MKDNSVKHVIPSTEKTRTNLTIRNEELLYKNANIRLSVTFSDLSKLAILKFGSIKDFGRAWGVGRSRASQILLGVDLPTKPETIRRISTALAVDEIVLTQLFSQEVKKE